MGMMLLPTKFDNQSKVVWYGFHPYHHYHPHSHSPPSSPPTSTSPLMEKTTWLSELDLKVVNLVYYYFYPKNYFKPRYWVCARVFFLHFFIIHMQILRFKKNMVGNKLCFSTFFPIKSSFSDISYLYIPL